MEVLNKPNSCYLWQVLIYFFNIKKSTIEAHQTLTDTYYEAIMSEKCVTSNFNILSDFYVEDQHSV